MAFFPKSDGFVDLRKMRVLEILINLWAESRLAEVAFHR